MPIPHRIAQLLTQGALVVALVLALTVNPRMRIRPNWFLGLYTVLAVTSLTMSVRLVGLGTAYRSVRLVGFLAVLWLLTPWWGRRDLTSCVARCASSLLILASVVLGLFISPGKAMPGGRLSGTIWPIWSTQVAHYAAEVAGLTRVLWLSRLVTDRRALMLAVPAIVVWCSPTRGLRSWPCSSACWSRESACFSARRHVRQTFAAVLIVLVVVGVPAAPYLTHWLARGENSQQLQDLTGRTKAWSAALAVQRPTTNVIFGSGLSNDAVNGSPNAAENGLPIDSSWISIYQDQGIVGEVLVGAIFLLLLLTRLHQSSRADAGAGALSDRLRHDRGYQRERPGWCVAIPPGPERRGVSADPSVGHGRRPLLQAQAAPIIAGPPRTRPDPESHSASLDLELDPEVPPHQASTRQPMHRQRWGMHELLVDPHEVEVREVSSSVARS